MVMETLKQYKVSILHKSIFLCMVGTLGLAVTCGGVASGSFLCGYLLSVINFHLLSGEAGKLTVVSSSRFPAFLLRRFFLRYGMLALGIYTACAAQLSMIPFAMGLVSIQLILVGDTLVKVKSAS